jgi:hypothetical protein
VHITLDAHNWILDSQVEDFAFIDLCWNFVRKFVEVNFVVILFDQTKPQKMGFFWKDL